MNETRLRYKIADQIINSMKLKRFPWKYTSKNAKTQKVYSGINFLILGCFPLKSNLWATYDQWKSLGMNVEKRPSNVKDWGVDILSWSGKMKKHTLFNLDQVFGKDLKKYINQTSSFSDYSILDSIFNSTGVLIEHQKHADPVYWRSPKDYIVLPEKESFSSEKRYQGTKIHELFHWAESRMNWSGTIAQGELIAEIGTGILESNLNLDHDDENENCLKYYDEWIQNIEQDPNYIFLAAAQAEKTAKMLLQKHEKIV